MYNNKIIVLNMEIENRNYFEAHERNFIPIQKRNLFSNYLLLLA